MVGHQEVIQRDLFHHLAETLGLGFSAWADQRVLRAVDSGARFQLPGGPSFGPECQSGVLNRIAKGREAKPTRFLADFSLL
jgi:hypothetical protein